MGRKELFACIMGAAVQKSAWVQKALQAGGLESWGGPGGEAASQGMRYSLGKAVMAAEGGPGEDRYRYQRPPGWEHSPGSGPSLG